MSTVFFSHASAHMDAARDPVRRFPATGFDRAFDNPDLRPGPDVESDPDDWNRLIAFLSNGHKPEQEAVRIFGWNAIDALELAGPSVECTKPGGTKPGGTPRCGSVDHGRRVRKPSGFVAWDRSGFPVPV